MTKSEMEKVKEALMDCFHIGYEYGLFKIQQDYNKATEAARTHINNIIENMEFKVD